MTKEEIEKLVGRSAEEWGYHEIDYSSEWIDGFETALDVITEALVRHFTDTTPSP